MPWQRNRSMERVTSEKEKTGGPEAKIPRPGLVFILYGAQFGSTANELQILQNYVIFLRTFGGKK